MGERPLVIPRPTDLAATRPPGTFGTPFAPYKFRLCFMQSSHPPRDPAAQSGRWVLEQSRGNSLFHLGPVNGRGASQRSEDLRRAAGHPHWYHQGPPTEGKCQLPSRDRRAEDHGLQLACFISLQQNQTHLYRYATPKSPLPGGREPISLIARLEEIDLSVRILFNSSGGLARMRLRLSHILLSSFACQQV